MKITSASNETVKLLKSLEKRSARKESGLFLIEGDKLILEAARSGLQITHLLYDQAEQHQKVLEQLGDCPNLIEASPHVIAKISSARTPQGILAAAVMVEHDRVSINAKGRYVMLDRIQDPGNLGTIFRTAEAFGLDGIILSGDTTDVFGSKVVRGAMGSTFRLPFFVVDDMEEAITSLQQKQMKVYGATLGSDSIPVTECPFDKGSVLLIGNEGNGLSERLCSLCDLRVIIPMKGQTESLNASVAAAILMWELLQSYDS